MKKKEEASWIKFEKTLYLDQAMRQSKETAISAVFSMAVAAVSIGVLRLWEYFFKTVGFKETNIVLMYLIGVFLRRPRDQRLFLGYCRLWAPLCF